MPQHVNLSRNKKLKAPRASFHDYAAPGYYHITITAHPGTPRLSAINMPAEAMLRRGEIIIPHNTPLGECVKKELLAISVNNPKLRIRRYVIMPDHIHFILQVVSRLEKNIGKYIAPFTKACSQHYTRLAALPVFTTLFQPFDDQILFDFKCLDRAFKYIMDNPRRYLIRRRYPDLFKRHLHIVIDEHEYAGYGNLFLLKSIHLLAVRVHRYWSQTEFNEYTEKCLDLVASGAVPITPAIHKAEKEIIRKAIDCGSNVILLQDLGFNDRFKPQGELFDLCASGRLLLLSPWPDNVQRRSTAGSTEFHKMNDHAAAIAALPASARLSLRF